LRFDQRGEPTFAVRVRSLAFAFVLSLASWLPASAGSAAGNQRTRNDWPMFGASTSGTSLAVGERALNASNLHRLQLVWRARLGGGTRAEPIVAGGIVYTVDNSGAISGFRVADGRRLWTSKAGAHGVSEDSAPTVAAGRLYVGSGNDAVVYCLNAANGKLVWQATVAPSGNSIYAPPRLVGTVLYVPAGDLVALRARDGAVLWKTAVRQEYATPAYAGGVLFLPGAAADLTPTQDLFAVSARDGRLLWTSYAMRNFSNESAAAGGGLVYIGSSGGDLNAYRASGCAGNLCHPVWTYTASGFVSAPALAAASVYIDADKLYALDAASGRLRWSADTGGPVNVASPTVANGVVFTGTNNGKLLAFRATGCNHVSCLPVWQKTLGPPTDQATSATIAAGHVFVADSAGMLSAFALRR
jgi:outer membrane protein assembly factor BamB